MAYRNDNIESYRHILFNKGIVKVWRLDASMDERHTLHHFILESLR